MKYDKYLIILSFVLIFIFNQGSIASGGEMEKVVYYNGVTLLGKLQDNSKFEVKILLENYKGDASRPALKFWGYDRWKPTYIIKEFKVVFNGKEAVIPKKNIIDLCDINLPDGFYLMQTKNAVLIHIDGGDGISAYHADLRIEGNRLVSRTIEFINSEGERDKKTTIYM